MFGKNLKRIRQQQGLSQKQVAEFLMVSPQSVSKWECGDGYPDITLLPGIAHALGITIDELMGNDEIASLLYGMIHRRMADVKGKKDLLHRCRQLSPHLRRHRKRSRRRLRKNPSLPFFEDRIHLGGREKAPHL